MAEITNIKKRQGRDRMQTDTRLQLAQIATRIIASYDELGGCNHPDCANLPSRAQVVNALRKLITLCFPGYSGIEQVPRQDIAFFVDGTVDSVYIILREEIARALIHQDLDDNAAREIADQVSLDLLEELPRLRAVLMGDVHAAYGGDPAAKEHDEIILSYPCVTAIATYRIAHELYNREVPLIPRIMSEWAHSETGIDIHPGATIGDNFFIDHGTGVVIGETSVIGQNVKLYQGVTLGALSFRRDPDGHLVKGGKRHPTIEDEVVVYSGATILGGETVIGARSVIGANVWITGSVPPETKVTIGNPKQEVVQHSARTA